MVVSTGMSTEAEIRETVDLLRGTGAAYALLHCQSTYPAPFKDVNLRYLQPARRDRPVPGRLLRSRARHPRADRGRRRSGAKIVEKHFTTDRELEGNDHKVSLLPASSRRWCSGSARLEEALGSAAPRAVSTGEMMNRVNLAKSLVAARRIEAGETITADAVDIKSPGPRPPAQRARPAGRPHRQPGLRAG